MKAKKIIVLVLSVCLIFGFTACGSSGTSDSSSGEEIVIKIGHTDSEKRSTNTAAQQFKEYMEENTDGHVKVEIYPNGTLGDDDELLKSVGLNTCQIYIGGQGVLSGQLGDKCDIFDLPYLYDSEEAWENGSFEQGGLELYNEQLEGTGYKCLTYEYDGTREILTTKKAVNTVEDMEGIKLRVNDNNLYLNTYKALNANPTPMAFGEVYTGLANGTIDGVDHVPGVIADQKWYENAKNLTLSDMIISPLVVITSDSFYDSLPEDIQKIFNEGIEEMAASQRELEVQAEKDAIQELKNEGINVIELSDKEKAKFKKTVQSVYDQYRESVGDDLIDEAMKIAEKANAAVK